MTTNPANRYGGSRLYEFFNKSGSMLFKYCKFLMISICPPTLDWTVLNIRRCPAIQIADVSKARLLHIPGINMDRIRFRNGLIPIVGSI